jgi:hypothetical protein
LSDVVVGLAGYVLTRNVVHTIPLGQITSLPNSGPFIGLGHQGAKTENTKSDELMARLSPVFYKYEV